MKITSKVLLFVVMIFQFVSCDKGKTTAVANKTRSKSSPDISKAAISKTEIDDFSFPVDSTLQVGILQTGVFHDDEVDQNSENKTWFGLFKDKEKYTLSETKLSIKHAQDPVLDEEGEQTGWEVSAEVKDTCVILIEKLPGFVDREIQSVKIPKSIYPGNHFKFSFKGTEYTLSATGEKKKERPDSEWFVVSNYKLYLESMVNGKQVKELLVSQKNFDDQMIMIIFAGDIDGDDKLDLIIDTSYHYNLMRPTIYMSKSAENGKIIKPIGVFATVGC
jgi:hypothetical protein